MSKVYVLKYSTGEYEDYREYSYGYFSREEDAKATLEKFEEFNRIVKERNPNWLFLSRAYRLVLGLDICIDYTGIFWSVEELQCLDGGFCGEVLNDSDGER